MEYKKGDRVKHLIKTEWGVGEVLEDEKGGIVRIFFVDAGEKTISLKHSKLDLASEDESAHPVLDNLKIAKKSASIKYQSLTQSKNHFLEKFPEGFYGERFEQEERDYKIKAYHLAKELLNKEAFTSLINDHDYDGICKRALRVANATNLIFPNEKMALKDGLADQDKKQQFSIALFDLLHGEKELRERFDTFARFLESIKADKWTIASYFQFITQPNKFMFIKPTITQHVAELCGFEINYQSKLNWLTYKSVLDFSSYLKTELADLEPRDMIDVQSFIWCIAP